MKVKIESVSWDNLYLERVGDYLLLHIGSNCASLKKKEAIKLAQFIKENFNM